MTEPRFAIVTTTINVPKLLDEYAADALRFSRNVEFIVVGDKKTPTETADYCRELSRRKQIPCTYLSVGSQEEILSSAPSFARFLPYNCIQRRNVGMLHAYREGFEVVVTIDDDNLLCDSDYLGQHAHVGKVQGVKARHSQSGWTNVCEMLKEARGLPFYHRGHPLSQRFVPDEAFQTLSEVQGRVVVNAGLWLDDPDVDALTRLYAPIRAVGTNPELPSRMACQVGTWAPFNSQNTALLNEVIPAYCLFPHCGRYDDIWASYVVRRIADHLGDFVSYGSPLVRQKRNEHDLLKDFEAESLGLRYTDAVVLALRSCVLTGQDYKRCFSELSNQIEGAVAEACSEYKLPKEPLVRLVEGFHEWTQLF